MHIRNRFAAVAPCTLDELFEQTTPVQPSSSAANTASYEKPRDLWALRALPLSAGRAVGIRLVDGRVLKVAVVTSAGLKWHLATSVLTPQQAAHWARTGQFYKA